MKTNVYFKQIELTITRALNGSSSTLYNVARWARCFIDKRLIDRHSTCNKPFTVIYQQGRVASTSVYESLCNVGLCNPIYHVHTLSATNAQKQIDAAKASKQKAFRHLYVGKMLSAALVTHKAQHEALPWKVISIVRDPLAIMISLHFLNIKADSNAFSSDAKALAHFESMFSQDDPTNWAICTWFDNVFLDELGVDVYQHPFNTEKGFSIIKEDKLDILILRFDDLNQAFKNGCAEFFAASEKLFNLKHANVHKNTQYDERLSYIKKNLKVPRDFCNKVYSTKLMKHFYSPAQIEALTAKWAKDKL